MTADRATTTPELVDHLDEDPVTVPGLTYALVSFVGPTTRQRADKLGLKIRGAFGSKADAEAHVKRLQRLDPTFDVYLVEMYKWLCVPPSPDDVPDQRYQEDFLNEMVRGYKESQFAARQHFEERKRLVMAEGLDKHLTPEERLPPPAPGTEVFGGDELRAIGVDPDAAGGSGSEKKKIAVEVRDATPEDLRVSGAGPGSAAKYGDRKGKGVAPEYADMFS